MTGPLSEIVYSTPSSSAVSPGDIWLRLGFHYKSAGLKFTAHNYSEISFNQSQYHHNCTNLFNVQIAENRTANMTHLQLKLLAATVFLPFALGVRADFWKNIPVREIHEGDRIDEANDRVEIPAKDGFVDYFACDAKNGKVITLTDDKKFAACCLHGQKLLGSPETAFDCCASGHALAGKEATGYHCCPTGQDYDGSKCTNPSPVCQNGKVLVDGKCACPQGTKEAADGTCKKKTGCDSGIMTGV